MMQQIQRDGSLVTLIHYVSVSGDGREDWRIACIPAMLEFHQTPFHPSYQRSNDLRVVTCPACKKAVEAKKAVKQSHPDGE